MKEEKIIIVDNNDNIIGSKLRSEIDYKKDIHRVSAVFVTNSNEQVLITHRKLTKDTNPGLWGPAVAGTVEEGETYEENAYKEAEEEIGLTGVELKVGPKRYREKPRAHFTQWFLYNGDIDIKDLTIQEDEVEQIVWADKETLINDTKENPGKYVRGFKESIEMLLSIT